MTTNSQYEVSLASIQNQRKSNQDSALAFTYRNEKLHFQSTLTNHNQQTCTLTKPPRYIAGAILCDGLHQNGDQSSQLTIDLFREIIENQTTSKNSAIERFNLRSYARIKHIEHGATTALVCLIDSEEKLHMGYIGDTRLYFIPKKTNDVHLLTRDHNYQRQIMQEEAGIQALEKPENIDFWDDPEEIEFIHLKGNLIPATSRLTKSIGYLMRHDLDEKIYEIPTPAIIDKGDTLALLTDGAYEGFRNKRATLGDLIRNITSSEATRLIINIAEDCTDDNATAIILKRTT